MTNKNGDFNEDEDDDYFYKKGSASPEPVVKKPEPQKSEVKKPEVKKSELEKPVATKAKGKKKSSSKSSGSKTKKTAKKLEEHAFVTSAGRSGRVKRVSM